MSYDFHVGDYVSSELGNGQIVKGDHSCIDDVTGRPWRWGVKLSEPNAAGKKMISFFPYRSGVIFMTRGELTLINKGSIHE